MPSFRSVLFVVVFVCAACSAPAHATTQWGTYAPLGAPGSFWDAELTSADELIVAQTTTAGARVAVQPPGGGSVTTQPIDEQGWASVDLAVDGQGAAILTWIDKGDEPAVHVSRRPPGGIFGLDRVFPGPALYSGVAANRRGDLLVVWSVPDATFAALRTANGVWGDPVAMPARSGQPQVRLSDSGWAVIAWPGTAEGDYEPLFAVTLSPAGVAGEAVELQRNFGGLPVSVVIDDKGHFALGWYHGELDRYEGPLTLAYGHDGAITERHALGSGTDLVVAANHLGEGLLAWKRPTNFEDALDHPNRMATLDLRDGTLGEDLPAPGGTTHGAVSDAGDRLLVGGFNGNFSARARRGGQLRAVMSFGCELNPARPWFAGIDSMGQAIVVSMPQFSDQPHVARDQPSEYWGTRDCGSITPGRRVPTEVTVTAGALETIDVSPALDPETSRQQFQWDFDGDGNYEQDTGDQPSAKHVWPLGRSTVQVRDLRWFGDTLEERAWRVAVEAIPPPLLPPAPKPRLVIHKNSLKRTLRQGIRVTYTPTASGKAELQVRQRLSGGRSAPIAKRGRTVRAGIATTLRIPVSHRTYRRLRRLKTLRVEVRAQQGNARVTKTRATLK
jgi:hypothetical protein